MDIHLRDLKYFEAVADLGHVGQAADKLGRTQPALTKARAEGRTLTEVITAYLWRYISTPPRKRPDG